MAKQTINLGEAPDGAGGDDVRGAFTKTNANFTELYNDVESLVGSTGQILKDSKEYTDREVSPLKDNINSLNDKFMGVEYDLNDLNDITTRVDTNSLNIADLTNSLSVEDVPNTTVIRDNTGKIKESSIPLNGIGVGQRWVNKTSERVSGVGYQNTSGKPKQYWVATTSAGIDISEDGESWEEFVRSSTANYATVVNIILPRDHWIKQKGDITDNTYQKWWELEDV